MDNSIKLVQVATTGLHAATKKLGTIEIACQTIQTKSAKHWDYELNNLHISDIIISNVQRLLSAPTTIQR